MRSIRPAKFAKLLEYTYLISGRAARLLARMRERNDFPVGVCKRIRPNLQFMGPSNDFRKSVEV